MLEFMNIAKALRVGLGNDCGFVSMIYNPNRIQARKV